MKKIVFGLLTFLTLNAYAQNPAVLTHSEAVKVALQKSVTLNQEKNNLFASQVQRNSSIQGFLPAVSIDGQGVRSKGPQQNPENGNLEDFTNDFFNASISASINLFNGFRTINTLNQNVNAFKAQSANVQRTEQQTIFDVTNQYMQVLLDQELVRIAEENMKAQQVLLDQIRESVRLGARAEADLYNQDAQVKNFEVLWLNSKVTLENDKALLAQTLQLDPSQDFVVEFPKSDVDVVNALELSLDSLYQIALAQREDLKQIEYQINANEASFRSTFSGYLPRVTAFASYGSNYYSSLKPDPRYGNFNSQFFNVLPSTAVGFSFSIPIYDRGLTRYNRSFSKVQMENSELRRENLKKSIMIDVKRSYNNYRAAIESYKASEAQYQAGELAFRTQQESYLLGVSNQVTLAQASQTFVQAQASRAQAEVRLFFQKILISYALGTLQAQDVIE